MINKDYDSFVNESEHCSNSLLTQIIVERFLESADAKRNRCNGQACRLLINYLDLNYSLDLLLMTARDLDYFLRQYCYQQLVFNSRSQAALFLLELRLFFQYLDLSFCVFRHAAFNAEYINNYEGEYYRLEQSENLMSMVDERRFSLSSRELCSVLRQLSYKLDQCQK